ncbi:NADPH-dependent F420 reductase [Kribbella qitaiheensis]|nr:NAD(P)-binding domain-containing protein [Kribbella qitaiheensis]
MTMTMTMTTIAVLGSGRVGSGLAGAFAKAGHTVVVGTRAQSTSDWAGPGVTFADHAAAVRQSDIVVNATPGDSSLARLTALRGELAGKILIDLANATKRVDGRPGELCYPTGSLGELLQEALPDTRVVKALNTMLFSVMTDPHSLSVPPTAFLSADDASAKAVVRDLLISIGWPGEWIEDLGSITTARATEATMLLVTALVQSRGFRPIAITAAG